MKGQTMPHTHTDKIATVFGGSGFVGRYIVQRLAQAGWRVRVITRHPNRAGFLRPYGSVGQIDISKGDIRDEATLRTAITGADAVINCLGILSETRGAKFATIHATIPAKMARIAASANVAQFIHISALGTAKTSRYTQSKIAGEIAVRKVFPKSVILRPSIVFGAEDQFFNRFARMAKILPILPLVGGATLFQPVFVEDIARVAVQATDGRMSGIYELGGPAQVSFKDLIQQMLTITQRKNRIFDMPFFIARIQATVFDMMQIGSFGIFTNTILTRDQVETLRVDNIVLPRAKVKTFKDLGIAPTPLVAVLAGYLSCHRPAGQYGELITPDKS